MNTRDIRNQFKSVLSGGGTGLTFVWPNVEPTSDGKPPAKPYAEVRIGSARQTGGTLKGNEDHIEDGFLNVQIVVEEGTGENAALDFADAVAALFTEGNRISITGGEITILERPDIRDGFQGEADWRVPVITRYRAVAA